MKLCLCQLILSDCNVLVLDEPTNYLDLPSLRALERMLGVSRHGAAGQP